MAGTNYGKQTRLTERTSVAGGRFRGVLLALFIPSDRGTGAKLFLLDLCLEGRNTMWLLLNTMGAFQMRPGDRTSLGVMRVHQPRAVDPFTGLVRTSPFGSKTPLAQNSLRSRMKLQHAIVFFGALLLTVLEGIADARVEAGDALIGRTSAGASFVAGSTWYASTRFLLRF